MGATEQAWPLMLEFFRAHRLDPHTAIGHTWLDPSSSSSSRY